MISDAFLTRVDCFDGLVHFLSTLPIGESVRTGADIFGTQNRIPEGKERLRKVGLDAPCLMVDIVVSSIVGCDELQRIPGKMIATMIIDSFHCRTGKEAGALAHSHACHLKRNTSTERVQQETLERVIIQSPKSVRDVEPMVSRMEFRW